MLTPANVPLKDNLNQNQALRLKPGSMIGTNGSGRVLFAGLLFMAYALSVVKLGHPSTTTDRSFAK
jgi:hypothetical protein